MHVGLYAPSILTAIIMWHTVPIWWDKAWIFCHWHSDMFVIVTRVQLGESLKTMIYADYPEQWPTLLRWVKHNLLDQQVYGILFVLRILSRKYAWVCDTNEFTFFIISVIFPFASVKAINANCTFLLIQNPVKSVLQEMVFMFLNLSSFVFSSFHGIMFVYVHMHVTISCI